MTNFGLIDIEFEYDYIYFELNRMYPLNHTGANMITVNDSHLRAIARAVHFVRSGITVSMSEKLRSQIDHDIELLDQAHKFIRQQIMEPGLPMIPEPENPDFDGGENGNPDTLSSN